MSGGVREGSRLEADNGLAFERKGPEMKSKLTRQFGILAIALVAATGMAACEKGFDPHRDAPSQSQMLSYADHHWTNSGMYPAYLSCGQAGRVNYTGGGWTMSATCGYKSPYGFKAQKVLVWADWSSSGISLV